MSQRCQCEVDGNVVLGIVATRRGERARGPGGDPHGASGVDNSGSATPTLTAILLPALRRGLAVVLLSPLLLAGGCASPLPTVLRPPSKALADTDGTFLANAVATLRAPHPELSGFHAFNHPHDALSARLLLAGMSERGIDAQYFIWNGDAVGTLLWSALWQAAERGVRVRLLLDDANTSELDPLLAALEAHPNIELRLYNPFVGPGGPAAQAALLARFAAVEADPRAQRYADAVQSSAFVDQLLTRRVEIEWTTGRLLYDDPAKTLDGSIDDKQLLLPALTQRLGRPLHSLDIVSPYFVPGAEGTALLAALAQQGVRVRVLTNSLASSDESVVHAGYMKRRHDLLRAGIELYEMKPGAADGSLRVRGRVGPAKVSGLHAKTYAVDGQRVFIGSFNLDMRSARLNTEMGLVIDSPAFARDLAQIFEDSPEEFAYRVRIAPDGENLQWLDRRASGEVVVHEVDPETTVWKRLQVGFLAGLPIDWLL